MDADLHQWYLQNEHGNYTMGWAQYSTMPMHDKDLGFGNLTYIAPGPPPPISFTSIPTTVTPVTPSGGSRPHRVLTDDDRRLICEYHKSHPGVKQTEIGGTPPASYPPLIL
jgi:hypothetical protein